MKLLTTLIRPMLAVGIGLAAVSAAALGLPSAPGLPDAPNLRLSAASHAATAPAEGAYWHMRMLSKTTYPQRLGSGSNRYWVEERGITETWISTDGTCWTGDRSLGTLPKSAADKKAWRRDGSPAKWSRTADGKNAGRLSTKADNGRVQRLKGVDYFYLAGQQLTYEEVQRLPAEPSGLRDWLAKAARVGRIPEKAVDEYVAGALRLLLYGVPAPKEVRAAAYQALLTMPGARSLGKVKDAAGRTGMGLSLGHWQLIVNTDEMVLLARDSKTSTMTLLQVGWTNTAPSVPALP